MYLFFFFVSLSLSLFHAFSLWFSRHRQEQGHKEIPIWLGEEPRYVSGVNKRTSCNDIIKALIDDEIRNGGNHDYFANRNKCKSR